MQLLNLGKTGVSFSYKELYHLTINHSTLLCAISQYYVYIMG